MATIHQNKILRSEYNSFRQDIQWYFISEVLPFSKTIFDPMAGTAPLIPFIEQRGISAFFNDIVPVHYYVNQAKKYKIYRCIKDIEKKSPGVLHQELCHCMSGLKNLSLIISEKWIPDEVLYGLIQAWEMTNKYENELHDFFKAIILLSISDFSSVTQSKVSLWKKPGGITSPKKLENILAENIRRFFNYYAQFYTEKQVKGAAIHLSTCDFSSYKSNEKTHIIITAPPLANRFDPINLYAPEIYFLSESKNSLSISELQQSVLGSNKIKQYRSHEPDFQFVKMKSKKTADFLLNVKKKQRAKENGYYFRYYTRYYKKLFEYLDSLIDFLLPDGYIFIVVQNNIHRGELNCVDEFILDFFHKNSFSASAVYRFLRNHQGKRNISSDHPILLKRHHEVIIRAHKC